MKHAHVLLITILMFIMASALVTSDTEVNNGISIESESDTDFRLSYVDRGPITIDNDTHLVDLAGTNSWPGGGNSTHPYIIENYNITASSDCINIQDVSLYFIIRGCLFNETTNFNGNGVHLDNVSHAQIKDSIFTRKWIGIYAVEAPTLVVDNCTVFDCWRGIYTYDSSYVEVKNCNIFENAENGVATDWFSDFCKIFDNDIWGNDGSGVQSWSSKNGTVENNTIYDNDFVMLACGINLHESTNWTIIENDIYENSIDGIALYSSHNTRIIDNEIRNNTGHGIDLYDSQNCSIIDNTIFQNRGEGGRMFDRCGVYLSWSDYCEVLDNEIFNNTADGVFLEYSINTTVAFNQIYNNTQHGISVQFALNLTLNGNLVYGNKGQGGMTQIDPPSCGIFLLSIEVGTISDNVVFNNTDNGITIESSSNITLNNNTIYENTNHGLIANNVHNTTMFENTIFSNAFDGVNLTLCKNWTLAWNLVYDNLGYGISFDNVNGSILYYNDIGWNTAGNAYDNSTGGNDWDNGVETGNWWSDHIGSGTYSIANGTSVDNYPEISLYFGGADPTGYEFTTTGHLMPWTASALNPWKYEALRNGSQFAGGDWDGSTFDVSIDGFPVGVHNITVIVYHVSGHSAWAQSIVEVEDEVGPTWVITPTSQDAESGEPFIYQVSATDPSGISKYWLGGIGANAFTIDGAGLITNATILEPTGFSYEFGVWANDTYNNYLSAVITVTVRDTVFPVFISVPEDIQFEEGETGNNLTWTGYDHNLYEYAIFVNDTKIVDEFWYATSIEITISVDDFTPGVYNVTIRLVDVVGNIVTHTVWVTVTASTTTTTTTTTTTVTTTTTTTETTTPPDGGEAVALALALGGGGVIIVVVVVVIAAKKRGG